MVTSPITVDRRQHRTKERLLGIDGVRGLFMIIFMAYHFGIYAVTGAWIGMNLFFVMSAYLIVSLLLRERSKTGRIDVVAFYRRRIRRLIPGLTAVLLFVAAYSWLFQKASDQKLTGGDILASYGFILNWRLINRSDDYFGDLEAPSLLRHLWTLSVEEQFYIFIPFLMLMLVATRSRKRAILIAFAIVAWSIWRTITIGVGTLQDQAHAYYGTDTRVHAFAIGLALAIWIPLGSDLPRGMNPRRLRVIGVVGFIAISVGFLTLEPMSPFMFEQGGMLLFTLASAALVLGVSKTGHGGIGSWFSHPVLVWAGVRAYGLYIWHWPVNLVISWQFPDLQFWVLFTLSMVLTFLVAGLSFRYLERPIMENGLKAISLKAGTRRLIAAAAILSVVVSGIYLARTPVSADEAINYDVPTLLEDEPEYLPSDEITRVGLLGDSVATGLAQHLPSGKYEDVHVVDLSVPGCDFSLWSPAGFNEGPINLDPECVRLIDNLEERVREANVDVVLMLGLQSGPLPHFTDDGEFLTSHDVRYLDHLGSALNDLRVKTLEGGAKEFVALTVPCRFGMEAPEVGLPDVALKFVEDYPDEARRYADPKEFNAWLINWSANYQVPVLDLGTRFI